MWGTVKFFVMVGVDEYRPLTQPERKRVVAAAQKHLKNEIFLAAFYGGRRSLLEAALLATAKQPDLNPIKDAAFSLNLEVRKEAARARQEIADSGCVAAVKDWLEKLRSARLMRSALLRDLVAIINELDNPGSQSSVLVVATSPPAEIAALDPANTPVLGPADIICYKFQFTGGGPCDLISSNVLKAPAIE